MALLLLLLTFGLLGSAGNAQTNDPGVKGSSVPGAEKRGVEPASVETTVGEITEIPASSVPGTDDGVSNQAGGQCHRQKVTMSYNDSAGKAYLEFTGIKWWCYDGWRVTSAGMDVEPWIRPDFQYKRGQDGYRYVPSGLKKKDEFLTYNGRANGAHNSVRVGRFEYRLHGFGKPAQVINPYVSRTGRYNGACDGPKPKDVSPKVTTVKPSNRATGVPATANVEATFSNSMNPKTLRSANFYLVNERTGAEVRATYRYDAAKRKAILDPVRGLSRGATYTANVFSGPYGARTAKGDPILASKTWTFAVAR